jgi:hypothetical protein
MATLIPDRRGLFIRVCGATSIPDTTSFVTASCVILDYCAGKTFSEIVAPQRVRANFLDGDGGRQTLRAES